MKGGLVIFYYIEQEEGHAAKVSRITEIMVLRLGYKPCDALKARNAALLHDIGKRFVPPEILNKPGKLTAEEFTIIKTHTNLGHRHLLAQANIAKATGLDPGELNLAAILAKQHHERIDGSGYDGIKGAKTHPLAKLVAVADVFDALMSYRPYKMPWPSEKVVGHLLEERGVLFEAKYVDLILECLDDILVLYEVKVTVTESGLPA